MTVMSDEAFQNKVLHELERLQLMIAGTDGDPNNRGVFGKLTDHDREFEYLHTQRKDASNVASAIRKEGRETKEQLARYRWMGKGVVAGASLNLLVLAKLFSVGPL